MRYMYTHASTRHVFSTLNFFPHCLYRSIGCTVFEMATKSPPWSDMPPMTAIFAIGSDSKPVPQLPQKISADARDFYVQCLTRDPNKRPSATALLKHAFILRRRKSRANSLAQMT